MTEFSEKEAQQVLSLPPSVPSDLSLFSSNTLFGQPGIYPEGPPMHPAVGPPLGEHHGAALLRELLEPETAQEMTGFFRQPRVSRSRPRSGPSRRAAAPWRRPSRGCAQGIP